MDDESPRASLSEAITEAISEWHLENGGFPIAFVCAVDSIDSDGKPTILVTTMDDQPTHRSMGLATYMDAWYKDDAQVAWQRELWNVAYGDEEED